LPVVTTFYPTYDGNGNICEYLDGTGTSKAHYEYDAFGNVTFSSGDKAADFAYRFSTKPFDFITGWYYYLYRYYDPLTGRWPSRDPIDDGGGVNLYGFCYNSSLLWVDYLGNQPKYQSDRIKNERRQANNEGRQRNNATEMEHNTKGQGGATVDTKGSAVDALPIVIQTTSFLLAYKEAKDKCNELAGKSKCKVGENCPRSCSFEIFGYQTTNDSPKLWSLNSAIFQCKSCLAISAPTPSLGARAIDGAYHKEGVEDLKDPKKVITLPTSSGCVDY
jgi:RHS repeat-associated protein